MGSKRLAARIVFLAVAQCVANVDKADGQTVPRVTGMTFIFGDNNTYERGEELRVRVTFSQLVVAAGAPQVGIRIGSQTRYATVVENSEDYPTTTLDFIYAIQSGDRDTNGASVPANSIRLNGGSIRSSANRGVNAALAHAAVPDDGARIVNGSLVSAPRVSNNGGHFVFSNPPADGTTYTRGEEIWVVVQMDRAVTVTGNPRAGIRIGSTTRYASYDADARTVAATPNADFRLWFTYTVQSGDTDTDGINMITNAISLNGGTIRLKGTTTNANLANQAKNPAPNRKVDGSRFAAPRIDSISFFKNGPAFGDTYGKGETIEAVVYFDHPLTVTGTPKLTLAIGSNNRDALYPSASPRAHHQTLHRRMRFRYTVQATDRDTNGLSIAANALALNGGTIRAQGTTTNAVITHSAVAAHANRKVDGGLVTPEVAQVAFANSPAGGNAYKLAEEIEVTARFDSAVSVATSGGTPSVGLAIGSNTRQATYDRMSGASTLVFSYTVQAGDMGGDGIEVAPNSLLLNGGAVTLASGTAPANLQHDAVARSASRQVNGNPPTPSGVTFLTTGLYDLGADVRVAVAFDLDVTVTGAPELALGIGSDTVQAAYDASRSSSDTLVFVYTVRPADRDGDGISVAANALGLNGATIRAVVAPTVDANLDLGSHAVSNDPDHTVDGSVETAPVVVGASFATVPPSGDTYQTDEEIRVAVAFDRGVAVTGTPQLALTIGTATAQANYDAAASASRSLVFAYRVRIGDLDADGVGVAANALTFAGGSIVLAGGSTSADLDLGGHAISGDAAHKVEGLPPAPSGVVFRTTGPYDLGEEVRVAVAFDLGVEVTGAPQLALGIGTATVRADYEDSRSSSDTLVFAYTVRAADRDADGISIAADALSLEDGTVQAVLDPTAAATLDLGSHTVSNASGHTVDGSVEMPPGVAGAAFHGSPPNGDAYGLADVVRAAVSFDRTVEVTGTPELALTIGTATRQAGYDAASSTNRRIVFAYQVRAGDQDTDGAGFAAGALTLAGGTIVLESGSAAANLNLGGHAIANDAAHKVDGRPPAPSGVAFLTTGPYELGVEVRVAVAFDLAVEVTGAPRLTLTIGADAREAAYVASLSGSNTLAFAYTVRPTDRDADGISVAADALSLEGGTIRAVIDPTADAELNLGGHAVANLPDQGVDGSVETAPTVASLAFSSSPTYEAYGPGEEIRVTVTFNRTVAVTGMPWLALVIGKVTQLARYQSGSGTPSLTFGYVVQPSDRDRNGISIPANALLLNKGTIKIAGGAADAVLELGDHAVADAPEHRVDGPGPGELAFAQSEYEFELSENAAGPLALGSVTATDPFGGQVEYALDGAEDRFEVDATSGELTYVGDGEDRERRSAYSMTASATVVDRTATALVTVTVANENEAPVFRQESWSFGLAENTAGPLVVGAVEATDVDEGDTLVYALADGDPDLTDRDPERFQVDAASGEVRYLGPGEDFESGDGPWMLEVTATDLAGLSDRAQVTVSLANDYEAPVFADTAYAFLLPENARGPLALGQVSATDPDEGDRIRYRLAEGDRERFQVDAASGEVRYLGSGENFESGDGPWTLEVTATDLAGLSDRAQITVSLANNNEAPSFAEAEYVFELRENARGPLALGRVSATDPDEDDQLRYWMAKGDPERFRVDAASGSVRYVGDGEDYEDGPPRFALTVRVSDAGGLTDTAAVTVTVLNLNEAPAFADTAYVFELPENAAGPREVGRVSATDPDEGDALTYSLAAGGAGGRFQVDPAGGSVRYLGAGEDYEDGPPRFSLAVRVADAAGLTDTASVTVTVLNLNEAPTFADTAYLFELPENAAGPREVGRVSATDPDDGDALTYSLAAGGDGGRFQVDPASGSVRYVGDGEDYEDGPPRFSLAVRVADAAGLTDAAAVTVTVLNLNERPVAVGSIAPITLEAGGGPWEEALGPYFRDPDGDALSFQAESPSPTVALAAVSESGQLSVIPQAIGATVLQVTASDPGGLAAVHEVPVAVVASRSERARTMELTLAAFGRSVGTDAVEAIGGRLGMASSGSLGRPHLQVGGRSVGCGQLGGSGGERCGLAALWRSGSALAGMRLTHPEADGLTFNPVSRQDLLSRSSFQLSFGGGTAPADSSVGPAPTDGSVGPSSGWTMWGQAAVGEFEGSPGDGFDLDGRTRSVYAGIDYRFASGLLLGLAGSRNAMESDFHSGINGAGTVDARLTSLYPYMHWSPRRGLGLWGLAGAGRGTADLTELAGGRFSTALSMRMAAAGARQELTGALALKADAFTVRIDSRDAADLAGVSAAAQRVRVASELAGRWAVTDGASLLTRLEAGGRFDGGDAETGIGTEVGATLGFAQQAIGLTVEARGRALVAHQQDDFREWGAAVAVRLQPGRDQGGFSLSLEPSWGNAAGNFQAVWREVAAGFDPTTHTVAPTGQLAMELRYRVLLPGDSRVEPFSSWSREGPTGYRLNVGVGAQRTDPDPSPAGRNVAQVPLRFTLRLYGERLADGLLPPQCRLNVEGNITFR